MRRALAVGASLALLTLTACGKTPSAATLAVDAGDAGDAGAPTRKLPESFRSVVDPSELRPSDELVLELGEHARDFALRGDELSYRDVDGSLVVVSMTSKERVALPSPCRAPSPSYAVDDAEVCCAELPPDHAARILCVSRSPSSPQSPRVVRDDLPSIHEMAMDASSIYVTLADTTGVTRLNRRDGASPSHEGRGDEPRHFAVQGDMAFWDSAREFVAASVTPTGLRPLWRGDPAAGPVVANEEAAFWANSVGHACVPGNENSVWRYDRKTGHRQAVAIHEEGTRSMALTSRYLYWTVDDYDALRRVDLQGYMWPETVGRHMKISALLGSRDHLYWVEQVGENTRVYRHDERTEHDPLTGH